MGEQDLLLATPLFFGLKEAANEALTKGERRSYPKGGKVFEPGRFTPALGVVLSGELEVTRGTMRMDTLFPGNLFGAAALFDSRGRYPTTLTALGESRVLLLPRALMEDLLHRYGELAIRYIAYLTDRVNFLSDRLDTLGAGPAAEKLLCFLRDRGGRVTGLTGEKLAASLGLSRATLYRALESLTNRGLMIKQGKTLMMTDQLENQEVS